MNRWMSAILFGLLTLQAYGQEPREGPQTPTPVSGDAPITPEVVEERKTALASAELSDSQRSAAEKAYADALEQLRAAEDHEKSAADWKEFQASAAKTLDALQRKLATARQPQIVDVPADATVAALDQLLANARQALADAEAKVKQLQDEPARRAQRRLDANGERQTAQQLIANIDELLKAPPTPGATTEQLLAERTLQQASRLAAQRKLDLIAAEISAYDGTKELLEVELQAAQRSVLDCREAVEQLTDVVAQKRSAEANEQARQARLALAEAHPLLQSVAEQNLQLTEIRTGPQGLAKRIEDVEESLESTKGLITEVEALEEELTDKLDLLNGSAFLGDVLLRVRRSLPRRSDLERRGHARNQEVAKVRIKLVDLRRDKSLLQDLSQELAALREQLDSDTPDEQLAEVEEAAEDLYVQRQELCRALERDYTSYLNLLNELGALEQQLQAKTEKVEQLVNTQLMWIQGHGVYTVEDLRQIPTAVSWLCSSRNWRTVGQDLWKALRERPVFCVASLLLFMLLAVGRSSLQSQLRDLGDRAAASYLESYWTTLQALGVTFLLTWLWPSLVFGIGICLFFSYEAADFTRAVGAGLIFSGSVYVALEFTRRLLSRNGLAEAHFRWMDRRILIARYHLLWLSVSLLPVLFLLELVQWEGDAQREDSLGRVLFIVSMLLFAFFLHRVLRPLPNVVEGVETEQASASTKITYWAAVLSPLLVGLLSLVGYHYTATQLALRLFMTGCLVLVVMVFHGLAVRWLRLVRGRLALQQAQQRRAAQEQAEGSEVRTSEEAIAETEPEVDLEAVNRQTRQLLHVCVSIAAVAGLWLIWLEVLPFADVLERPLWAKSQSVALMSSATPQGNASAAAADNFVTISDLLLAILVVMLAVMASRNIPGLIEISLPETATFDSGARYAMSTVIRYVIVGGGLVVAVSMIGIGWSRVQWLVAALSVGVGFGLQELVANFVSGLILLFERPVRVGDIVTVDDVTGVVTRVQIRATTIRNWDRQDYVVPNKDLITGRVLNWTLSNDVNRVVINVGVAYESDPRQVRELLDEIVRNYEHIMDDPAPLITFETFGDSTLNFVIRAFLANMDHRMETINDLHTIIHQRLAAAGIEIAFPQRDINIRSLPSNAELELAAPAREGAIGADDPRKS